MNGNNARPYSRQRIIAISFVAAVAACIALIFGFNRAALGIAAALPVGILNHSLMVRASRKSEDLAPSQGQLMVFSWSMVRMGISIAALLASISMGPEFIIGVLTGLLCEMVTHISDTVKLLVRTRR